MNYKTNLKKSEFDKRDYIFKGQHTKEILNIESFNHNFENIDQFSVNGMKYDDSILGFYNNIHRINTESVTKRSYNIELPQHIIDFCRNYENLIIE